MQSSVVEGSQGKLSVHCIMDKDEIKKKRHEVLMAVKDAPVKGFRNGKVPLNIVSHVYKDTIKHALRQSLVEEAYHQYLFDSNVKPFGSPTINDDVLLNDDVFECSFDMYKMPEFELKPYKDLKLPKYASSQTRDDLIEKSLHDIRVKFSDSRLFNDDEFVQEDDQLIISYDAFVDGEKVDELSSDGELFSIGSSNVPEFDTNIIGMKANETKEFTINASEALNNAWAGKQITFKLSILTASKRELPPLNDELAQKLDKPDVNTLRYFVASAVDAQETLKERNFLMNQVINTLIADYDFEIPDWAGEQEGANLANARNASFDSLDDAQKAEFIKVGKNNIKLALVLQKIRDEEPEAQLTDSEAIDSFKSNLEMQMPTEQVENYLKQIDHNKQGGLIVSKVKDEFVLDFIIKHSTVSE
jgi:trigger factor